MKHDATADRLLRSARALFAAHGYSGTSIRQITARAHTNLGAVTYHFGTKRELYHAVLDAVVTPLMDRVRLAAGQPGPPLARIEGIIRAYFGHLTEQPDMPLLMVHQMTLSGPFPPPLVRLQQTVLEALVSLVGEGQREGSVREGAPLLYTMSILAQPVFMFIARRAMVQTAGLDLASPAVRATLEQHAVTFARRGLATTSGGFS
ncbi:MAG: TetR/AcrR family transcriptional regulator [Gemmatimonadota bacterium]